MSSDMRLNPASPLTFPTVGNEKTGPTNHTGKIASQSISPYADPSENMISIGTKMIMKQAVAESLNDLVKTKEGYEKQLALYQEQREKQRAEKQTKCQDLLNQKADAEAFITVLNSNVSKENEKIEKIDIEIEKLKAELIQAIQSGMQISQEKTEKLNAANKEKQTLADHMQRMNAEGSEKAKKIHSLEQEIQKLQNEKEEISTEEKKIQENLRKIQIVIKHREMDVKIMDLFIKRDPVNSLLSLSSFPLSSSPATSSSVSNNLRKRKECSSSSSSSAFSSSSSSSSSSSLGTNQAEKLDESREEEAIVALSSLSSFSSSKVRQSVPAKTRVSPETTKRKATSKIATPNRFAFPKPFRDIFDSIVSGKCTFERIVKYFDKFPDEKAAFYGGWNLVQLLVIYGRSSLLEKYIEKYNPLREWFFAEDDGYSAFNLIIDSPDLYEEQTKDIINILIKAIGVEGGYRGLSPFFYAIVKGNVVAVEALFDENVDLTQLDSNGFSIIHTLCMEDHDDSAILSLLSKNKTFNINLLSSESSKRKTPIMLAALNNNEKIVDFLLLNLADLTIKDTKGLTALDYSEPSSSDKRQEKAKRLRIYNNIVSFGGQKGKT